MVGFTKLHATILDSSIWLEPVETRIVWIAMLAMADRDGVVLASVGGLAHRANVSVAKCARALETLLGPDPDSRDGTTGERIEKVPGGWLVLNHANYRDKQTREQAITATRVAKHRAARKALHVTPVTRGNAKPPSEAEAEAEAEAESRSRPQSPLSPNAKGNPLLVPSEAQGVGSLKESGESGDRGSEGQARLFAELQRTTIRSRSKNRRAALSRLATTLDAQGMTPAEFRVLDVRARQESEHDPGGLLLHWLENGWREKVNR